MAFEQLKAEIAMLVQQMDDEPEDVHELHARIRQKLAELKATGQPLPDDLVDLERRLDSEERSAARSRASSSSADQQPAARPSRRQTAGRSRRPAARKKASPAKQAKRPAAKKGARKSAAAGRGSAAKKAGRGSAAKKGGRGAAKATRSPARKAKRSSGRGRR
jgi:hypothetical protein